MASRSGRYDLDGRSSTPWPDRRPTCWHPWSRPTVRPVRCWPAADPLGLRAGMPVVIGAGDRACEVVGSGATEACPWSVGAPRPTCGPLEAPPTQAPAGVVLSRGATGDGYWREGCRPPAPSCLDRASDRGFGGDAGRVRPRCAEPVPVGWWPHPGWRGPVRPGGGRCHRRLRGPALGPRPGRTGPGGLRGRGLGGAALPRGIGPPSARGGATLGTGPRGGRSRVAVWADVVTGVLGLPARTAAPVRRRRPERPCWPPAAVGLVCDLDRLDPVDRRLDPPTRDGANLPGTRGALRPAGRRLPRT